MSVLNMALSIILTVAHMRHGHQNSQSDLTKRRRGAPFKVSSVGRLFRLCVGSSVPGLICQPVAGPIIKIMQREPVKPKVISTYKHTLPQINMEAHCGPYIEDSSLVRGLSTLPC